MGHVSWDPPAPPLIKHAKRPLEKQLQVTTDVCALHISYIGHSLSSMTRESTEPR